MKQLEHLPAHGKTSDTCWETPAWLYDLLNSEFDFQYDLAAIKENAKTKFFKNSLNKEWHKLKGWLWLNPPFSGIREWVEKADHEMKLGAKIVMLFPANAIGAPYMKKCIPSEIRFLSCRPIFRHTFKKSLMQFSSIILIFDKNKKRKKFSFIEKPKELK